MPCVSWRNGMSGLPKKKQHLALLLVKSSALLLCLTANCTFTWPPTERQRLKANPILSRSQHQHQLLGLSTLFPEKYFLLTFIRCHRAKSSRSEQESEWKRAPFATLQHYILIRQVDKASPLSYTISLEVEVKTTCSVLLFVDDLSLKMLIFPVVSWSVNTE